MDGWQTSATYIMLDAVLLLLFLGQLTSRRYCLDGPKMNVWESGVAAFFTEPVDAYSLPTDWPRYPSPLTLEATSQFVEQHGAMSPIQLLEKGVIPADTVGHDTAAMHPYSRMLLVQLHFT
ncbi:uncharacterized protein LOC144114300 isoform X2 [Amblyomma americanum]